MTQMEERYLYLLVWNKCLALSTQKVWETVSIYEYRDKKLLESIEISNSSSSLVWAKSNYWIDKKKGETVNLQEYLESAYWFSSSKGLPSLQLTEKEELLNYLNTYGIDATWLREKSSYILNDVVLKTWFEKGSQRYSFDNLGDVKIIESSVLK